MTLWIHIRGCLPTGQESQVMTKVDWAEPSHQVSERRNLHILLRRRSIWANMPQGLSPEEMVYFRLSADIDMKDIPWVPLNNADPYSLFVDFDGDGHDHQDSTQRTKLFELFRDTLR